MIYECVLKVELEAMILIFLWFFFLNFQKACPFKFVPNMHANACCGFSIPWQCTGALHWAVQSTLNFLLIDRANQNSCWFGVFVCLFSQGWW